MGFKISDFSTGILSENGAWFIPKHPVSGDPMVDANGTPLLAVKLRGQDSEAFQRGLMPYRMATQAAAEAAEALQKVAANGSLREAKARLEEARALAESLLLDLWCSVTVEGIGFEDDDGNPLDMSDPAQSRAIWRDWVWLRTQADTFVMNRGNYLAASGKGCLPMPTVPSPSKSPKRTAGRSRRTAQT